MLSTPDITSLIRDTEPHERALFSVPPPQPPSTSSAPYPEKSTNRRQTVFNVASGEVTTRAGPSARAPRRNTAVAAVLGAELHTEVKRTEGNGEIDIEVLLRGAEKLNDVYSIPGVPKRIEALRTRHGQLMSTLAHYEAKVAKQERELGRMNKGDGWSGDEDFDNDGERTPDSEAEEELKLRTRIWEGKKRRSESLRGGKKSLRTGLVVWRGI
jgi:hypothetical protein